jgi:hypothetical protein
MPQLPYQQKCCHSSLPFHGLATASLSGAASAENKQDASGACAAQACEVLFSKLLPMMNITKGVAVSVPDVDTVAAVLRCQAWPPAAAAEVMKLGSRQTS